MRFRRKFTVYVSAALPFPGLALRSSSRDDPTGTSWIHDEKTPPCFGAQDSQDCPEAGMCNCASMRVCRRTSPSDSCMCMCVYMIIKTSRSRGRSLFLGFQVSPPMPRHGFTTASPRPSSFLTPGQDSSHSMRHPNITALVLYAHRRYPLPTSHCSAHLVTHSCPSAPAAITPSCPPYPCSPSSSHDSSSD